MFCIKGKNHLEGGTDSAEGVKQIDPGPFKLEKENRAMEEYKPPGKEWNVLELSKYVAFIEQNIKKIEGKPLKYLWNLFSEMEKFVETRNFRQCKLHHQKMLKSQNSISSIIEWFKRTCDSS